MHELSIALSILDLAAEEAGRRGGRVVAVHLKLGPLSGVVKEALTPEEKGQLELYELTLNPGASSGTDFLQHTGEKAGYILSGSLRLWLDNQAHLLEAGDSFRFPSIVPHMFDNPTQQAARVIWVTTLQQTDSPAG